jgi:NADH:ubiquinone oxidoreductase subunit E
MSQKQSPVIVICMGSSCFSRGNKKSLHIIKQYLQERSLNATVIFRGSHCFGVCENGPVLVINDQRLTNVSPSEIPGILDQYLVNQQG